MAASIRVDGWLNDVKVFDWGTVLKVSSTNSKKNAAGEWETVSRDYYDVVLADGVSADGLEIDTRVIVTGTFKKGKSYQKKDGTHDVELKVRATAIEPWSVSGAAEPFTVPAGWAEVGEPF